MFDTSVITEVTHSREGSRLTLEWKSSALPGTFFQVYIAGELAWYGTERHATVAAPRGLTDGQIGAVASGEETTDFGGVGFGAGGFGIGGYGFGGLPLAAIKTRAFLSWYGFGASHYRIYEGLAGFGQGGFGGGSFGGQLLGNVTALEQGLSTGGFGQGGFGADGFAALGGNFSFTTQPLTRGDWHFSVVPYDQADVPGTPSSTTVTITAPPRPPAPNSRGKRLAYVYDAAAHTVTLNWLASSG